MSQHDKFDAGREKDTDHDFARRTVSFRMRESLERKIRVTLSGVTRSTREMLISSDVENSKKTSGKISIKLFASSPLKVARRRSC